MAYFYSIDKYIAKTIAAVDRIKRIRRITPCLKQVFLLFLDKSTVLSTASTGNFFHVFVSFV